MFIDEGEKGSKEERKQFQEMIACSRQIPRPIDGIVVWSFARFARDQLDSQFYKADLRKRGYVVLSYADDIPNNALAPLMEAFADWKNQRFLEDLSIDTKRGQLYVVEQGFWVSSHPPFGYRMEKVEMGVKHSGSVRYGNRLVKDEPLVERVALAWQMKLQKNASYREIQDATHLFARMTHYREFFGNMIYAGVFVFNGNRYPVNWADGSRFCEPYVSLEEYYQVQENRQQRSIAVVAPRTLSSSYLLSGLLQCGLCAEKGRKASLVGGKGTGSNYRFYRCTTAQVTHPRECDLPRKPSWRLDEAVIQILKETILKSEYLEKEVEHANARPMHSQHEVKVRIEEVERLVAVEQKRVESIVDLIGRQGVTPILEAQYQQANKAWLEATSRLGLLRSEKVSAQTDHISLSQAQRFLEELLATLDDGLVAQKRALIARFVDYIEVFPDYLIVRFKFDVDSFGGPGESGSFLRVISGRFDEVNDPRSAGAPDPPPRNRRPDRDRASATAPARAAHDTSPAGCKRDWFPPARRESEESSTRAAAILEWRCCDLPARDGSGWRCPARYALPPVSLR